MINRKNYKRDFTDLKGEIVKEVTWDSDLVTFKCESGSYTFEAYGGCCSASWIEAFDGFENIKGEILDVRELELPYPEDLSEYNVLQVYGYAIDTTSGTFVLEFRNDSNGNYGGSLGLR